MGAASESECMPVQQQADHNFFRQQTFQEPILQVKKEELERAIGNSAKKTQVVDDLSAIDDKYSTDYCQLQDQFLAVLKKESLKMKEPGYRQEPEKQKKHLKKRLIQLDQWIDKQVKQKAVEIKNPQIKAKYVGMISPFDQSEDPLVILNLQPELAQVFETSERALLKITYEVCNLSEVKQMNQCDNNHLEKSMNLIQADEIIIQDQLSDNQKENKPQVSDLNEGFYQGNSSDSDLSDCEKISEDNLTDMSMPRLSDQNNPFKQKWKKVRKVIQGKSQNAHYQTYQLKTMIFKFNDDCRQEVLAMQLLKRCQEIYDQAGLHLWLRPYEILVNNTNCAQIEFLTDTISIDQLKKKLFELNGQTKNISLRQFYMWYFGKNFKKAQQNFIKSLAGYSLFCFVFNVKDRHNANILIDRKGHILHIDFGFMLQNAPGYFKFESAPFKLTQEYVDLLGGFDSDQFRQFKTLFNKGLLEIRQNLLDLGIIIMRAKD